MPYAIKEIFYSLQGEGVNAGCPAIFCRFSGCNLWSDAAQHKPTSSCFFCDTDFVGVDGENGGKYPTAPALAEKLLSLWPNANSQPFIIFTGGEPCLQLDEALISELKKARSYLAIETNGTYPVPSGIDWITVSPKDLSLLAQKKGDELRLIYPFSISPKTVEDLDFTHFCLSPLFMEDHQLTQANLKSAIAYCLTSPRWRLSVQLHKLVGIK